MRSTCPLVTIVSSTDSPESRESNKYINDIAKVFYCLRRALQTDSLISKNHAFPIFNGLMNDKYSLREHENEKIIIRIRLQP